jgi:predicted O-methyltransferase YrrM
MKIILTPEESENIFLNALCNGHGLSHMGLTIDHDDDQYHRARHNLEKDGISPCLEDVWVQVLREGGTLTLIDNESGEDPAVITLADVHNRVSDTDVRHLMDAINEQDDAITAEVILQQVFYGEVIFG